MTVVEPERRTHRRAESTIDLEDGELVEGLGVGGGGEVIVRDDLVGSRRLDAIPHTSDRDWVS